MKPVRLLFLTIIVHQLSIINCQAQSWLWAKQPYFTGNPASQSFGQGRTLATDIYGNVYTTGYFGFASMIYGADTLVAPVENDFLAKYDTSGHLLWARAATLPTGIDEFTGYSVTTDAQGNAYVTGEFYDQVIIDTTHLYGTAGGEEVFVIKYGPNGNVLWARQSTPAGIANYRKYGYGVAVDRSGNVYVTGEFLDSIKFGPLTLACQYSNGYTSDVFLVKYDSAGNPLWARQGVLATEYCFATNTSVAIDAFDNPYITGQFYDTISFGGQELKTTLAGDIFLVKYDPNGNTQWARQSTNHSSNDFLINSNSIATDPWGGVYVAGSFGDTITLGGVMLSNPVPTIYSIAYGDLLLAKYDTGGHVLWAETATQQGNFNCTAYSVATDHYGHVYLAGAGDASTAISYSMKLGSQVFTSASAPGYFFTYLAELDTGGNPLCGSAAAITYTDWVASDPTGHFVYMDGGFLQPVTLGPDNLSLDNNPPNEGTTIPFVARWQPCNVVNVIPLSATIAKTDASCYGLCNGIATATGSGGAPPYNYLWDTQPEDTSQTVTGLCADGYSVTVTDNTGATVAYGITVSQPAAMVSTLNATNDSVCYGDSTTLYVTGNTTNLVWQYYTSGTSYVAIPGITGSVFTAPQRQTTLYRVIAGSGICTDTSAILRVVVNPLPVPVINASDSIMCAGDSVQLCAPAGFTSYSWNTSDSTRCIYAAEAGSYWLTATAANGCSGVSAHQYIYVYPVPSLSIVVEGDTLATFAVVTAQWLLNGDTIPGATGLFYVATKSGSYSVETTDSNGCFAISVAVYITVGLQNLTEENISIYPNPASSNFIIETTLTGSQQLQLFDITGQLLLSQFIKNSRTTVDVSGLAAGVYTACFKSDEGISTKKMVVAR